MMRYYLVLATILAAISWFGVNADAKSVYPTMYPFEKETYKPPTLPETKPIDSANFEDKTNPGGYLIRNMLCDPYSDDRLAYSDASFKDTVPESYHAAKPPGFWECRAAGLNQWKRKGNAGTSASKNCSALIPTGGAKYSESSFYPDTLDGKKFCDASTCCKHMNGMLINNPTRIPNTFKHTEDLMQVGLCTELASEYHLCSYSTWTSYCIEYYIGGKTKNQRVNVLPCFDTSVRWLMKCPVFKKSSSSLRGASSILRDWDTDSYFALLSPEQVMVLYPTSKIHDRVCNPYSYYFPEEVEKTSFAFALSLIPSAALAAIVF